MWSSKRKNNVKFPSLLLEVTLHQVLNDVYLGSEGSAVFSVVQGPNAVITAIPIAQSSRQISFTTAEKHSQRGANTGSH